MGLITTFDHVPKSVEVEFIGVRRSPLNSCPIDESARG